MSLFKVMLYCTPKAFLQCLTNKALRLRKTLESIQLHGSNTQQGRESVQRGERRPPPSNGQPDRRLPPNTARANEGDSTPRWAWGSRQEALASGADSGGLRTSQLTFLGLSLYLGIQRLIFRCEGSVKILPSNVYPKRLVSQPQREHGYSPGTLSNCLVTNHLWCSFC